MRRAEDGGPGTLYAKGRVRTAAGLRAVFLAHVDHAVCRMLGAEYRATAPLHAVVGMLAAVRVRAALVLDVDHTLLGVLRTVHSALATERGVARLLAAGFLGAQDGCHVDHAFLRVFPAENSVLATENAEHRLAAAARLRTHFAIYVDHALLCMRRAEHARAPLNAVVRLPLAIWRGALPVPDIDHAFLSVLGAVNRTFGTRRAKASCNPAGVRFTQLADDVDHARLRVPGAKLRTSSPWRAVAWSRATRRFAARARAVHAHHALLRVLGAELSLFAPIHPEGRLSKAYALLTPLPENVDHAR